MAIATTDDTMLATIMPPMIQTIITCSLRFLGVLRKLERIFSPSFMSQMKGHPMAAASICSACKHAGHEMVACDCREGLLVGETRQCVCFVRRDHAGPVPLGS